MRTPEQILTDHGLWNYADNITLKRERLVLIMQEYASQFMVQKPCYNCDGSGKVPTISDAKCVVCNGIGKIIYLSPISTTFTYPPQL